MASTPSRSLKEGDSGDGHPGAPYRTIGSSGTDEECLCLATLDDRDAVIAIDEKMYLGLDFLPATYPSLVQGEGVNGHVYKIKDRVVSFTTVEIIDGGQTLLTSAGRVAPDCRGTGVYGRFTKQLLQKYSSLPGVRYFAFTTNNVNLELNGAKIMKTHKQMLEKAITVAQIDTVGVEDSITEQSVAGVRRLTEYNIKQLISADCGKLRHLFPEDRIVLGWKPYRLMTANLNRIFFSSMPRLFLASVPSDSTGSANPGDLTATPLVSCGSYFPCQLGYCYQVDVFGDGSSEQLLSHVEWHVRQSRRVAGEHNKVVLFVFFSRYLDDVMEMLKKEFPIRRMQHAFNKLVMFEQEL